LNAPLQMPQRVGLSPRFTSVRPLPKGASGREYLGQQLLKRRVIK
jgi:hypothetical protein